MINTARNFVSIAKQTNESTAATAPAFLIPLMSGSLPTAEKTHEETRETHKDGAETNLKEVKAPAEFNCFAYEELLPLLIQGVLGTDTVTGEIGSKTHLLTAGATLPRYTIWTHIDNGAGGYVLTKHSNVLLTSINIKADENGAAKLEVKGEGTLYEYVASVDTTSTIDLAESGHSKIVTADAVIKFSGNTQVPATNNDLSSFELEISRDSETTPRFGSAFPGAIDAKALKVKPKIEMRGTQEQFRAIMCGSTDATGIPSSPVLGSSEVKMFSAATQDKYLLFNLTNVVWKPSAVEADPEQGRYNMSCEGDTDGAQLTVTCVTEN